MTAVLILSIIQMFSGSRNFLQRYDIWLIYFPTFSDFFRLFPIFSDFGSLSDTQKTGYLPRLPVFRIEC